MTNDKNKSPKTSQRRVYGLRTCFLASCDKQFKPTREDHIFHHEWCRKKWLYIERDKKKVLYLTCDSKGVFACDV